MKKTLLITLVTVLAVLVLCLAGCGSASDKSEKTTDNASTASEDPAAESEAETAAAPPQFDVLPVEAGRCMVSDGEYLYFIGDTKLYRTNLDLTDVMVLDDMGDYRADSLCLADGKVYYATNKNSGSEMGLERPAFEIRCIDTDGQSMEVVNTSENEVYSLSMWNGELVFGDYDTLKIVEPTSDSTWNELTLDDKYPHYVLANNDGIYFTAGETNYENLELYVYREEGSDRSAPKLADMSCVDAFAVAGKDVYFLAESKEESDFNTMYDLMKVDAQGTVSACGVSGDFSEGDLVRLCPYGDYIFYNKFETPDDDSYGAYIPYCYNTVTGEESALPGYDDANSYTVLCDVAGGYAFFKDVSVGAADNHVFLSLTDPTVCKSFESVVANADESIVK
ncbi:MAG: DUF5050 domain-containing protein, partial [Eggerthellaceae bacterium]|nr:DUF5050 domain-containing protein [Eggerthellaceae bacterium]